MNGSAHKAWGASGAPEGVPDVDPWPGLTAIGPVASERKARDWALVLQSMSVWHGIRRGATGWVLLVQNADYSKAATSIDRYEAENRNWPPRPTRERVRTSGLWAIPVVAAALLAFFLVTGPEARGSVWFRDGVSISSEVLGGAPWRAVTALTLHADATHVLGNAIAGTVFGSAVQRRFGAGGASLAILTAGTLGNLGNALYYRSLGVEHGSLGASTALFGAIGLLAASELVLHRTGGGRKRSWTEMAAPLVGGFALLGTLGSGSGDGRTDLGAHLFGFLAGVGIGLVAAFGLRRSTAAVNADGSHGHVVGIGAAQHRRWLQAGMGALAVGLVIGAWELALSRVRM